MSAAVLDPQAAERIAKLLGMLGSHHDGEVLVAARKAHSLVRQLGCTWHDVIRISNGAHEHHLPRDWRDMARACRSQGHRLSTREFDFVGNIALSRRDITEKQMRWLADIFQRVAA